MDIMTCMSTNLPENGVCEEKMSEELCDVPQFVCVQLMNCLVLFLEHLLEREDVLLVQHAEPLKTRSSP